MQRRNFDSAQTGTIQQVSKEASKIEITVAVPIRVDDNNSHILSRLVWSLRDPSAHQFVNVMIVDDGSAPEFSDRIASICTANKLRYERLNTRNRIFSIGRARNHAAMTAATRFIFFMDVDLIPPAGFFKKLNDEIQDRKLDERAEDLIMIPVAYLTQEATEDYLSNGGDRRYGEFLEHTISRNPSVIEKFSTGTSACVYNRLYYLARGGNYEQFSGWGYEDLEFNLRVARLTRMFPIPENFTRDQYSFDKQFSYQGWKAIYRLFGDRSFLKGLMLFHAWHPVDKSSDYYTQRESNKRKFDKLIAQFASDGSEPQPLPDLNHGRSLLLKQSPFTYSRELRPMLGEVLHASAATLPSDEHLSEMLHSRHVNRIVFQNPYSSPDHQRIYDWCRRSGFPFIVCERGALPGSVLFDQTGFLADSKLFDVDYWDRDLSLKEEEALQAYIRKETASSLTLEAQADKRYSPTELREKLGFTTTDTIVLVCLQRPDDTATKHFAGPLGTYGDFLWQLESISNDLPANVRLAYKVHPLEDAAPPINGINVSEYHINDLFAVADKVVTFTSGTGVLAMLWRLPVVVCGRAFYRQPGLTHNADTFAELRDLIVKRLPINETAYRRFIHYLRFHYYSIGSFITRPVRLDTGSRMTATTGIRFESIRGFGKEDLLFACRKQPEDSWQSMLFDRYMAAKPPAAPSTQKKPPAAPSTQKKQSVASAARPAPRPWGLGRKIIHRVAIASIGRVQGYELQERLKQNPIDFFQKARWGPNRFFGRLLLDKSQRPY